ncbi:MAG TPA: ABC transporter ATP-binding protein [bacterium]|jgi:ABC-2 type transport system ATP-binding protein|nr:ABC transporter ATP-binding protein [bacterium]
MSASTGPQSLAVDVKDLTVRFGDFIAVDKVTFQVAKGEIFGFLGANGAGKTTTIRVLCGLLKPSSGEIHVGGESFHDDNQGLKSKSGYMSQKFTLYNDMTVAENLEFKASLRGVSKEDLKSRKERLFSLVGYEHSENDMVGSLPGGLKQQVSLAAALLHDPEIIFLDEPTAGVSPEARSRFWDIIRNLAAAGQTVFVTTHYMDEAEQCGRIALMRDGKLVALDSPAGLKKMTFPYGLIELEESGPLPEDWVATLRAREGVASLKPHGRRWHLEPLSPEASQDLRKGLPSGLSAKDFEPSLEDVFLKVVEPSATKAAPQAPAEGGPRG